MAKSYIRFTYSKALILWPRRWESSVGLLLLPRLIQAYVFDYNSLHVFVTNESCAWAWVGITRSFASPRPISVCYQIIRSEIQMVVEVVATGQLEITSWTPMVAKMWVLQVRLSMWVLFRRSCIDSEPVNWAKQDAHLFFWEAVGNLHPPSPSNICRGSLDECTTVI